MEGIVKKVMIIDDEVDIRTLLAQRLRANQYGVLMAANGAEALSKLRKQGADYVILDLKMPEMDGIEFMKEVADEVHECEWVWVFFAGWDVAVAPADEFFEDEENDDAGEDGNCLSEAESAVFYHFREEMEKCAAK